MHCLSIFAPAWRDKQEARLGKHVWRGLYSVFALSGLILLIYGYGQYRYEADAWYTPVAAGRHIAMALMLPVFPLLIAACLSGRISRMVRHPMLLAVCLWAAAHLAANHTGADVLLFGSFLIWAVLLWLSFAWRKPRPAAQAAAYRTMNDVIAVVGGLLLYALVAFWLHKPLTGVALI